MGKLFLIKCRLDFEACHKAMWMWLHHNPWNKEKGRLNGKEDWPGHEIIKAMYKAEALSWGKNFGHQFYFEHHCFACAAAGKKFGSSSHKPSCYKRCPCVWGKKGMNCEMSESFYNKWRYSLSSEDRSKLAKQIAESWDSRRIKKARAA